MSGFLDKAKIPLKCPKCGKNLPATVGGLKTGNVRCSCGMTFETKQFSASIRRIEKAEREFRQALRRIGKR